MPRKKKQQTDEPAKASVYTIELDDAQMDKLEAICDKRAFGYCEVAHARFAFKAPHEKVNIVAYKSGKVVIQGKGTEAFVQNTVETEITGEPRLGYEEFHNPEHYESHAGMDEAGKGDLFGPVCVACVVADSDAVREMVKAGVKDSKRMTDGAMLKLEKIIKKTKGVVVSTKRLGMPKYNEWMAKPRANLNLMVAWLHAKALEDALAKKHVPWGMLDQFSKQPLVQRYFKTELPFDLRMQTKAESDPVVAAASICARVEFLRQLKALSEMAGEELLKGASASVKAQAKRIVQSQGPEALGDYAKLHFRTAFEALGLEPPPKKVWQKRG